MKIIHFVIALAIAVAVSSAGRAGEEIDTMPAQSAAVAWLLVVDAGQYAQSWDEAAALFQKALAKPDWEKALVAARSPLGPARSRKVRSVTYSRSLPNAPEGEYVVIQYDTQFELRGAVETVVPMKEKDGWKVSGYFIR